MGFWFRAAGSLNIQISGVSWFDESAVFGIRRFPCLLLQVIKFRAKMQMNAHPTRMGWYLNTPWHLRMQPTRKPPFIRHYKKRPKVKQIGVPSKNFCINEQNGMAEAVQKAYRFNIGTRRYAPIYCSRQTMGTPVSSPSSRNGWVWHLLTCVAVGGTAWRWGRW